jgi:hypothetical protein
MNTPASGWHRDPTARHEYRYWDGSRWTDDVSDRGVTATDPMPAGGPGADPTEVIDATQAYPASPAPGPGGPASQQAPGAFGAYGTMPPGPPGAYGSYGSGGMPPATPAKKGPKTALLVGLGLLALVAVVVAAVLLTGGDDDDTATDELSDLDLPDDSTTGDDLGSGDSGDSGDSGESGESGEVPDDLGDLSEMDPSEIPPDLITDLVVEQLVASGAYTEEQATCITEKIFDELSMEELAEIGESGDMSSISPDQLDGMSDAMAECLG